MWLTILFIELIMASFYSFIGEAEGSSVFYLI